MHTEDHENKKLVNLQSKMLLVFCRQYFVLFCQIFKITALYFVANRKKEIEKGGGCKLAIIDYPSHLMI